MKIEEMLRTHPQSPGRLDKLARVIDTALTCAQACTACADACLGEDNAGEPEMVLCIRHNLACADTCFATGRVLSRPGAADEQLVNTLVQACARACDICGDTCREHAEKMEHCKVCADTCDACKEACDAYLGR